MRHVNDDVALTSGGDPATGFTPVHVRRRVAGRLAEEADRSAVDDALVSRRQRDLWRICDDRHKNDAITNQFF